MQSTVHSPVASCVILPFKDFTIVCSIQCEASGASVRVHGLYGRRFRLIEVLVAKSVSTRVFGTKGRQLAPGNGACTLQPDAYVSPSLRDFYCQPFESDPWDEELLRVAGAVEEAAGD